jgi:hypothetical protein
MGLSRRHQATLEAVFATPVRASIAWRDIEALFAACGGEISEGEGSRLRVALNGVRAVFHRPPPKRRRTKAFSGKVESGFPSENAPAQKCWSGETAPTAVRSVRRFLSEAGIKP